MLVVKIFLHLLAMAVVLIAVARFHFSLAAAGWVGIVLIVWTIALVAWVVRKITGIPEKG